MILRCRPNNCCWRAVFSPLSEVICCWILLFSAFWKLKCRFLSKFQIYISSSMRTSSFERLFFTSAVFIVSTDSRVSFSLLKICTSFLWLLSSLEMFLICCWVETEILIEFGAFLWEKPGWSRSYCQCRSSRNKKYYDHLPNYKNLYSIQWCYICKKSYSFKWLNRDRRCLECLYLEYVHAKSVGVAGGVRVKERSALL